MRKLVTVIAFLLGGLGVLTMVVALVLAAWSHRLDVNHNDLAAVAMSATIAIILAILAFVCLAWEE